MRFGRTSEQTAFAAALDDLLAGAAVPAAARAWADGDHAAGLKLWARIADLGVTGLLVPEEHGGLGASFADVAVAFERLGYHGVPGPWIETAAVAPLVVDDADRLARIAAGESLVSLVLPPHVPFALDADVAETTYLVTEAGAAPTEVGEQQESLDATRRLFAAAGSAEAGVGSGAGRTALDAGALACAAWLVGAGSRLLDDSVSYVGQRKQFGRVIGEFQALKHLLADVRVALDFAQPLVHNAALQMDGAIAGFDRLNQHGGCGGAVGGFDKLNQHGGGGAVGGFDRLNQDGGAVDRDVSAAKVAASDAAYLASRTGLQVHAAIGYTLAFDLSLWILKVRALVGAWGTPAFHRARVLDALLGAAAAGAGR